MLNLLSDVAYAVVIQLLATSYIGFARYVKRVLKEEKVKKDAYPVWASS